SVHLTDAQNAHELWSSSYERDASDVFAVQDDISRGITDSLRVRFAGNEPPPTASAHGTANPEAYDFYLRGVFLLRRRSIPAAATNFERAITRDSTFGRAYAGLSMSLALLPYFGGVPAADVGPRATAAARRALALDSTL